MHPPPFPRPTPAPASTPAPAPATIAITRVVNAAMPTITIATTIVPITVASPRFLFLAEDTLQLVGETPEHVGVLDFAAYSQPAAPNLLAPRPCPGRAR